MIRTDCLAQQSDAATTDLLDVSILDQQSGQDRHARSRRLCLL